MEFLSRAIPWLSACVQAPGPRCLCADPRVAAAAAMARGSCPGPVHVTFAKVSSLDGVLRRRLEIEPVSRSQTKLNTRFFFLI